MTYPLEEGLQDLSEDQLFAITGGVAAKTYTVAAGDSLSTIASKTYGSQAKWKELYQKNKDVIGNDPHFVHAGQKLTL
jgi:nucleoid-associated protein YgaU